MLGNGIVLNGALHLEMMFNIISNNYVFSEKNSEFGSNCILKKWHNLLFCHSLCFPSSQTRIRSSACFNNVQIFTTYWCQNSWKDNQPFILCILTLRLYNGFIKCVLGYRLWSEACMWRCPPITSPPHPHSTRTHTGLKSLNESVDFPGQREPNQNIRCRLPSCSPTSNMVEKDMDLCHGKWQSGIILLNVLIHTVSEDPVWGFLSSFLSSDSNFFFFISEALSGKLISTDSCLKHANLMLFIWSELIMLSVMQYDLPVASRA